MKFFVFSAIILLTGAYAVASSTDIQKELVSPLSAGVVGAVQTALARADVALCKSVITPNLLKGEIAESATNTAIIARLRETGNWRSVTARLGPQGIDGIAIKYNNQGQPVKLIVNEVKYGTSQLSRNTTDGIQLGSKWTNKRLVALGNRYLKISELASKGEIPNVKRPPDLLKKQEIQVELKNGKKVTFWRNNSTDKWKYDGSTAYLNEALNEMNKQGKFLIANGEGKLQYKKYLYKCTFKQDTLHVTVMDATKMDSIKDIKNLTRIHDFEIDMGAKNMRDIGKTSVREIAAAIRKKIPSLSQQEAMSYAKRIKEYAGNYEELVSAKNYPNATKALIANSLKAGGIGTLLITGIEFVTQIATEGEIRWKKIGQTAIVSGISITTGTAIGQYVTMAIMKNVTMHHFASRTASALGLGTAGVAASAIGSFSSMATITTMFAYGGFYLGWYDIDTANKIAVSGIIGSGAGIATTSLIMSVAIAYGTAGTGTAISTLSGVAATNAALAYIGGGTLAAGGGGMAAGMLILTSTTLIVGAAVTGAALFAWQRYDAYKEKQRTEMTINWLKERFAKN